MCGTLNSQPHDVVLPSYVHWWMLYHVNWMQVVKGLHGHWNMKFWDIHRKANLVPMLYYVWYLCYTICGTLAMCRTYALCGTYVMLCVVPMLCFVWYLGYALFGTYVMLCGTNAILWVVHSYTMCGTLAMLCVVPMLCFVWYLCYAMCGTNAILCVVHMLGHVCVVNTIPLLCYMYLR